MWFITAVLSASTFGLAGFIMKVSSVQKGETAYLLWGLYFSGTLGFLWWMYHTQTVFFTFSIFIMGIMIGVGSAFGNLLFMKALDYGPASLTSPMVNTNVVITLLMSLYFFDETLTYAEMVGVLLLIFAVIVLPIDPNESLRIQHGKWYALVMIATILFFLRNGGLKITEEVHLENTPVLFISYLFGLIWFSIEVIKKRDTSVIKRGKSVGLFWGMVSGLFSFSGLQLYAYSLTEGPASIVAPIFSTNSLFVAILSILIYREKLSTIQTMCLCLLFIGFVSIRFTSN